MKRKFSLWSRRAAAAALVALVATSSAWAQVPQLVSYQGHLTDDAGKPLTGVQAIKFSIYDASTAGNEVWSETQNVSLEDGLFTVRLGSVNLIPYDVFDGSERYLGVRLGAVDLLPRQRLLSVAYCFSARDTEQLGGRASSEFVRSVDGVAPASGNVDLVAGSNVSITPNASGHSVTIAASSLSLPFTSTISSDQTALSLVNNGSGYALTAGSTTYGVRSTSSGDNGYGVYGIANGANGRGIVGSTTGANGYGVWGSSSSHYGVYGSSTTGTGVYGKQTQSGNLGYLAGPGFGVYGEHHGSGNLGFLANGSYGVYGENPDEGTSGSLAGTEGVRGGGSDAIGVLGVSTDNDGVRGHSTNANGVRGETSEFSPEVAGVLGTATGSAAGVRGESVTGRGVHGRSTYGRAVYAEGDLQVTGAYFGDLELTGAYKGRIHSTSTSDGAPFPRPAYDSGWRSTAAGSTLELRHALGGDPEDYVVDLSFRNESLGINNRAIGGDLGSANTRGAYWRSLTNESIGVTRYNQDLSVEQFRIRIWVIK